MYIYICVSWLYLFIQLDVYTYIIHSEICRTFLSSKMWTLEFRFWFQTAKRYTWENRFKELRDINKVGLTWPHVTCKIKRGAKISFWSLSTILTADVWVSCAGGRSVASVRHAKSIRPQDRDKTSKSCTSLCEKSPFFISHWGANVNNLCKLYVNNLVHNARTLSFIYTLLV